MEPSVEELKFCNNCKKDIAANNYELHSVHCLRHIVACPICSESVPRSEIEAHGKTEHVHVACEKCKGSVEKWKLERHMNEDCLKRTLECLYCNVGCAWDILKDHEEFCGARTDSCKHCGRLILIKEMDRHVKYCSKLKTKKMFKCPFCENTFFGELSTHMSSCPKIFLQKLEHTEENANVNKNIYTASSAKQEGEELTHAMSKLTTKDETLYEAKGCSQYTDPHVEELHVCRRCKKRCIASVMHADVCSHCFKKFPPRDIVSRNQSSFESNEEKIQADLVVKDHSTNDTNNMDMSQPKDFRVCHRCNGPCPASIMHPGVCSNCFMKSLNVKTIPKIRAEIKAREQSTNETINMDVIYVACPMCKENFTTSEIHNHVQECGSQKCRLCSSLIKMSEMQTHETTCRLKLLAAGRGQGRGRGFAFASFADEITEKNSPSRSLSDIIQGRGRAVYRFTNDIYDDEPDCSMTVERNQNQRNSETLKHMASATPGGAIFCRALEESMVSSSGVPKRNEKPGHKRSAEMLQNVIMQAKVQLPCEFCMELFPMAMLIQHQSSCRPDLLHYAANKEPSTDVAKGARRENDESTHSRFQRLSRIDTGIKAKRGKGSSNMADHVEAKEFRPSMTYEGFPEEYSIYNPNNSNKPAYFDKLQKKQEEWDDSENDVSAELPQIEKSPETSATKKNGKPKKKKNSLSNDSDCDDNKQDVPSPAKKSFPVKEREPLPKGPLRKMGKKNKKKRR